MQAFTELYCLNKVGKKYEALALYDRLRKFENLTDYRKNLFITNEAWIF